LAPERLLLSWQPERVMRDREGRLIEQDVTLSIKPATSHRYIANGTFSSYSAARSMRNQIGQ
jgi:hypothetical protein